jgi:protein gp37
MAKRLRGRCGYPQDDPFKVTFHPDRLDEPFTWRNPSKVFVCSMGDLFHENVNNQWIYDIMEIIAALPKHIFIILTKRPDRELEFFTLTSDQFNNLPNVWFGVSAENQETAKERIPVLLQIPAIVRFVSCEPLLGEIKLNDIDDPIDPKRMYINAIDKIPRTWQRDPNWVDDSAKLNWVIAGGESGPKARPMHPDWVRSLRDQCLAAQVPFFFKQWGEWICDAIDPDDRHPLFRKVGKKAAGRLLDGREWNEWPR